MKLLFKVSLIVLLVSSVLLFLITVLFMFQKDNGASPTVFGYTAFVNDKTSSNSDKGDFIIISECDEYEKYELIGFENDDEKISIGKIKKISDKKYIVESNDKNQSVPQKDIYGKVVLNIPKLGEYITYIKTHDNYTWYALGAIALAIMVLKYGVKHVC